MIYSVKCDKPCFKNIEFTPGFNVILAERTKESTIKDSRNGLGKTALIEIIHFCLGGNKGETLSKKQAEGWTFSLELDLGNRRYKVKRNTAESKKVIIEGDCSGWPIQPQEDRKTGAQVMSVRDWNKVLGVLIFGLQPSYPDLNYAPSFRALIAYFVRMNGKRGGFLSPFTQYKFQLEWDKQLHNAFLLDLEWEYASKWQVLKDRMKVIEQIKQEAKTGILVNMIGTRGELEALKIRLEAQAKQEEDNLKDFKVLPQYRKVQTEANQLTAQIHELVNQNIIDKQTLEHYEISIKEEVEAKPEAVVKMFGEAGAVLKESVVKRLDDVLAFHKQVVLNRKDFLSSEMERIKRSIAQREEGIKSLTEKRAELLKILRKHGALEEFVQLQNNHQKTVSEIEDLKIRIENLKKFEEGKNATIVEQALLQQQASTDLAERKSQRERAILLFNSNSKALYQAPGTLSIDVSKTGYKFNVAIERKGSTGIGQMEIFCYDLMLAQIWAQKAKSPMFLVHDSILFADVDERQKALALELAAQESEKRRFQYICTFNSDGVPTKDFSKDFKFGKYVRKVLTDATEGGGLLGIRF
jgi:uncharacterized protein YydD (DUF2326 family)